MANWVTPAGRGRGSEVSRLHLGFWNLPEHNASCYPCVCPRWLSCMSWAPTEGWAPGPGGAKTPPPPLLRGRGLGPPAPSPGLSHNKHLSPAVLEAGRPQTGRRPVVRTCFPTTVSSHSGRGSVTARTPSWGPRPPTYSPDLGLTPQHQHLGHQGIFFKMDQHLALGGTQTLIHSRGPGQRGR